MSIPVNNESAVNSRATRNLEYAKTIKTLSQEVNATPWADRHAVWKERDSQLGKTDGSFAGLVTRIQEKRKAGKVHVARIPREQRKVKSPEERRQSNADAQKRFREKKSAEVTLNTEQIAAQKAYNHEYYKAHRGKNVTKPYNKANTVTSDVS